jgi:ABC-type nickel/cobalt efflux system permease component RcnA
MSSPGRPAPFSELQLTIRDEAAARLRDFRDNPSGGAVAAILLGAFFYGLLHAAGPGHRKTVVFALFLGRRARAWEPLAAGMLSGGAHAATGAAVILVLGLARGAVASLSDAELSGRWLEGLTFVAVLAIAVLLFARKSLDLLAGRDHVHGGATEGRGLYGIVTLASLVPCPGAIMILLFAIYLDIALVGLAAILVMSVGMGLVVSLVGYLAWFGRTGLFGRFKATKGIALVGGLLELLSYALLVAFSLYASWPFLAWLLAPR